MYSATTKSIRVTVEPQYLEDRSDPNAQRFFWAYTIEIANAGSAPVQILARHWIITDQNGRREDVRGVGVVGEQPVIEPGASFTYTSGCPLQTPSGTMVGTYQAVDGAGDVFTVAIPAFSLDIPGARRVLN
jgi:ApaG protein